MDTVKMFALVWPSDGLAQADIENTEEFAKFHQMSLVNHEIWPVAVMRWEEYEMQVEAAALKLLIRYLEQSNLEWEQIDQPERDRIAKESTNASK